MHLTRIGLTPLKGARHTSRDELCLDPAGPREDRTFCLLEIDRDRVLRTVENPRMVLVDAAWDEHELTVTTPDGRSVTAAPAPTGEIRPCNYWDRQARLEVMSSPHAGLIGDHLGRPVRLARIVRSGAVVYGGSVSLVTTGALRELGEEDSARFRATFTIDAAQDPEPGTVLQIGATRVRVGGPIPRCRVIDINPSTGAFDTRHLHTLAGRGLADAGLPFGVDAQVIVPGSVRTGDPVEAVVVPVNAVADRDDLLRDGLADLRAQPASVVPS